MVENPPTLVLCKNFRSFDFFVGSFFKTFLVDISLKVENPPELFSVSF